MPDQQIVTAASESYGASLLALLGSLTLNWPRHPPVLVYDLGLGNSTLAILADNNIEVVKVPPFCPHWRKHFTWKIWCWNNAPAQDILWLDAGVAVLQPLDDVFVALDKCGYFVIPNYQLLDWESSNAACDGCGVDTEFKHGKLSLAAGMIGFRKAGTILRILEEALNVARVETYIRATNTRHRQDQAIISLLFHKHLKNFVLSDGVVFGGWISPQQTPGQKIWVHRRQMLSQDMQYLAAHISTQGQHFQPQDPQPDQRTGKSRVGQHVGVARWFKRSLKSGLASWTTKATTEPRIYHGIKDE